DLKVGAFVRFRRGERVVVAGRPVQIRRREELQNARTQRVFVAARGGVGRARGGDVSRARRAYDARRKDEFALAFVCAKKERPVLDDGAAVSAAEVIISKFILPRLEEVPRVKIIVTQKIVSRAVKLVRARLDGDVDDRARIAPVFRRALRLNAEFGERIDG